MYVFDSQVLGERAVVCSDSRWSEIGASHGEAAKPAIVRRVGDGACDGDADFAAVLGVRDACMALPRQDIASRARPLIQHNAECVVDCFTAADVSADCGSCYGDYLKVQRQGVHQCLHGRCEWRGVLELHQAEVLRRLRHLLQRILLESGS
jgi:hypothetical protein